MSLFSPSMPLEIVAGPIDASVAVPGSKSISNRALICAALAEGRSRIHNIAPGEDSTAMVEALMDLGIRVEREGISAQIDGSEGRITGGGSLDARLAGTTSRFLTALCALAPLPTTITGRGPLLSRPMGDLHVALRDLGAEVRSSEIDGCLPVTVSRGSLSGGELVMRGDVSSQFLSALMLIGPYLDGGLSILLSSELVSRPYVEMTAQVMSSFGVSEVVVAHDKVIVPSGRYSGCEFAIESDASSASYPFAAAAIAGGRIEVTGLSGKSIQGDIRILEILERMGCAFEDRAQSCVISRSGALAGIDIDMADVSDLVPTVAVVAMFASESTRIRNVGFIRKKESDRIGSLVTGIVDLGGKAREHTDGLEIFPSDHLSDSPVVLRAHHDHRLAMAWSLVALKRRGVTIDDPSAVDKSWPQWWEVRESIRSSSLG